MNRSYLKLAREGNNDWWRYMVGILFIIVFWGYIGLLFGVIIIKIAFFAKIIEPDYPYYKLF